MQGKARRLYFLGRVHTVPAGQLRVRVVTSRFPEQLELPIEYARMHIAVMGWIEEAEDDDEREGLSELASYYLSCAIESGSRERDRLRSGLPKNLRSALDRSAQGPHGPLRPADAELVRMSFAVPAVSTLAMLSFQEMNDLADIFEGSAQDPKTEAIDVPRILGMADSVRSVAEVAGPHWRPDQQGELSLTAFLAQAMTDSRAA
jgi:hypothetical protein